MYYTSISSMRSSPATNTLSLTLISSPEDIGVLGSVEDVELRLLGLLKLLSRLKAGDEGSSRLGCRTNAGSSLL